MVVSPTNQDSGLKSRDQSTVCYRLVQVDETCFDMIISVWGSFIANCDMRAVVFFFNVTQVTVELQHRVK